MPVLEAIFWTAAGLVLYTLIGYPLITLVLAALVRRKVDKQPITPRVSFIIAAYNEEAAIADKLKQTLALDYPPEQLEIIVASDGSTDRTDEIVRSFADRGVKLYRAEGRKGKTNALNEVVQTATGEILIFSDATGIYNDVSIREMVANFNDPAVGCVTGRVTYRYGEDTTSQGFKRYQRFAVAVRQAETRFGSQTSVSGSIHAIRRSLFAPANPGFSMDVIDAVHAAAAGYRVVYENGATSREESRVSMADEFRCRTRISVRGTSMVPYVLRKLIGGCRFGYLFQMISHKIMRWWLWAFLLAALITNIALAWYSPVYTALAAAQIVFYLVGFLGWAAAGANRRIPLVSTVAFFVMANTAMAWGALKALAGKRMAKWEPARQAKPSHGLSELR